MRHMVRLFLVVILLNSFSAIQAADANDPIEVVELHNKTAKQLIPIIKPLLASGGVVSGTGYELIIKTSPDNFHQLEHLIKQLDKNQPLLLISVRRVHNAGYDTYERAGGQVDGGQVLAGICAR